MKKPPIIGFVMGVAGVAIVVFLGLLFFAGPGARTRPVRPAASSSPAPPSPVVMAPRASPADEPPARRRIRPVRRPAKPTVPPPSPEPPAPEPGEPPPLQAVFSVPDTSPPRIRVITPKSPAYLMTDSVTIRVRSEAGAHVKVEDHPALETAAGVYVAKATLRPGLNRLSLSAADAAGNTARTTLKITFIDPRRIHKVKDNLMSMLRQLDEIKQSVGQVDARTEEIIDAIADTEDAERVNQLSRDLREIRKTKRLLKGEIEKAFREINALLARQ